MRHWLTIMRLIVLVGLTASSASLADMVLRNPAFCDIRASCGRVTSSVYARPLGIPLPIVGLAGFLLVYLGTMFPSGRASAFLLMVTVVAGIAGAALILIQVLVLREICTVCLFSDFSGIGLMLLALCRWRWTSTQERALSWLRRGLWLLLAVMAMVSPIVWSAMKVGPPRTPPEVRALWMTGRITVVEVTDFECHHCARADRVLTAAMAEVSDVHFVRLVAPMPKHENGRVAARAYLSAQRQGKGEEMAKSLYAADARTTAECRSIATSLGLNMVEYDRAVNDPSMDQEIDATIAWAHRFERLPLIWVQDRFFARVPTLAELQEAIQQAVPAR